MPTPSADVLVQRFVAGQTAYCTLPDLHPPTIAVLALTNTSAQFRPENDHPVVPCDASTPAGKDHLVSTEESLDYKQYTWKQPWNLTRRAFATIIAMLVIRPRFSRSSPPVALSTRLLSSSVETLAIP